jgi:uncharacterized protein with PIN domain
VEYILILADIRFGCRMPDEFRICPECNYRRGFHSSFKKVDGKIKVIYICPECGSSFDLGIREDRIKDLRVEKGMKYG